MELTGSISLVNILDGKDGEGGGGTPDNYSLVFNYDRIAKFRIKDSSNKYRTTFSPSNLIFYAQEKISDGIYRKMADSEYDFSVSYSEVNPKSGEASFVTLLKKDWLLSLTPFLYYGNAGFGSEESLSWTFRIQYFWDVYQDYLASGNLNVDIKYCNNIDSPENISFLDWDEFNPENPVYVGFRFISSLTDIQPIAEELNGTNFSWGYLGKRSEFSTNPIDDIRSEIKEILEKLGSVLSKESNTFVFSIHSSEADVQGDFPVLGKSEVSFEWGLSEDLMNFAVNAADITASIDKSALKFSADGLLIKNGGLIIVHEHSDEDTGITTQDKVLYFNEMDGTLYIKGSGTFGGELQAASGTFKGELQAATGSFSGELQAATGTFSGELKAARGSFSGEINATSGILRNVTIQDENNPGNVIIINDTGIYHQKNGENGNFFIGTDGKITTNDLNIVKGSIGNILIDGESSSISGNGWSINPTAATFNNIVASGKISTAVFEQASTQMCGGTFLFKNGYSINEVIFNFDGLSEEQIDEQLNNLVFNFNDNYGSFNEGNLYLITNNERNVSLFCVYTEEGLAHYGRVENGKYNLILDLGKVNISRDENGDILVVPPNDWIIGINASSSDFLTNGLASNSVTLSSVTYDGEVFKFTPKIILGELPVGLLGNNTQTHGLYAESAFLTGTLTTQYQGNEGPNYAGINTLNGAVYNKNFNAGEQDYSKIIIWAGSDGIENHNIQEAKFQVTENGTLYAKQGYFEGSILTKATIEASTLRTTTIIGTGDNPALIIKDTNTGIDFINTVRLETGEEQQVSSLKLTNENLDLSVPITFNNLDSIIGIKGTNISTSKLISKSEQENSNTGMVIVNPGSLDFYSVRLTDENILRNQSGDFYFKIQNEYGNNYLDLYKYDNISQNSKSLARFAEDSNSFYNYTIFEKGIMMGDINNQNYIARYDIAFNLDKTEMIGVDLYIGG